MVALEQRVRERAYFLWIESGRIDGWAHEHWVAAETSIAFESAFLLAVAETAPITKSRASTTAKKASAKSKTASAKAKTTPVETEATSVKTRKAVAGGAVQMRSDSATKATKARKSARREASPISMISATTH